jgi:hypothetical protein
LMISHLWDSGNLSDIPGIPGRIWPPRYGAYGQDVRG